MATKEEFDRIHGIGKRLKEIFARDNVGGLNGMEDYIVRAVEEAAQHSVQRTCLGCGAPYVGDEVTTHFHFCPVEKQASR